MMHTLTVVAAIASLCLPGRIEVNAWFLRSLFLFRLPFDSLSGKISSVSRPFPVELLKTEKRLINFRDRWIKGKKIELGMMLIELGVIEENASCD